MTKRTMAFIVWVALTSVEGLAGTHQASACLDLLQPGERLVVEFERSPEATYYGELFALIATRATDSDLHDFGDEVLQQVVADARRLDLAATANAACVKEAKAELRRLTDPDADTSTWASGWFGFFYFMPTVFAFGGWWGWW